MMKSIHAVRQFILARLEREGGIRRMTGRSIFLTYISYLPFTRQALVPLFTLAPLKGELAFAKQKTEGSIFFTSISYFPLLVLRSCRAGTSFGSVEHQRKQNALWGVGHGSSFSKYTYSPPTSTSLGSAQQSSFTRQSDVRNILPFRQVIPALRPLIPQREGSLINVQPYLIVSRNNQRLL